MKTNCTKHLRHLFFLAAFMLTFFFEVKAQCHAAFTYVVNPYTKTVTFTSTSTGSSLSYLWTFGSGSNLSVANPVKTYTAFGTYTVCLAVSSGGTCYDSTCTNITISNPCNATFSNTTDSINPKNIHFFPANSGANLTYLWTFGDSSYSTLALPNHTYANAGTYTACLRVNKAYNGDTCTTSYCKTITVTNSANCHAAFTYVVNHYNKTVTFTSTSTGNSLAYLWKFGSGSNSSVANPVKTYPGFGTYTVCLYVGAGSGGTCYDSICTNVTINNPCNADFFSTSDTINSPKTVHFYSTNTGPNLTYLWTFGDSTTSTIATPTHTYANAGSYYACLRVNKAYNGDTCTTTYCKLVNVGSTVSCHAAFTYVVNPSTKTVTFTNTSTGTGTSYLWTFGDASVSSSISPTKTYSAYGTFNVCLKKGASGSYCDSVCTRITISNSCDASFSNITDSINSKIIHFYPTNTASNLTYAWTFGDSTTSSTALPNHAYPNVGTYLACLRVNKAYNGDTCTTTYCKSITVGTTVSCHAAFTYVVNYYTKTVTFTNTSTGTGSSYLWSFGDASGSTTISPVKTYGAYGTFNVCLKKGASGSYCDSVCTSITITNPCDANFTYYDSLPKRINFVANIVNTNCLYFWTFGDSTSSGVNSPLASHAYANNGSYNVCLRVTKYLPIGDTCVSQICHIVTVGPATCHAAFTYSINQSTKTVTFTNTSTGTGLYYNWKFGDNLSSSLLNPAHTYAANGTYNVCLKVYNTSSCIDSFCTSIVVANLCNAQFVFVRDTANVLKIHFGNTSTGDSLNTTWNFGDGTPSSTQQNPDHIYGKAGTYYVCMNVTRSNPYCSSYRCDSVTVGSSPGTCNAQFLYSVNAATKSVVFANTSTGTRLKYAWSFGDSTTSNIKNPVHSYSHAGTFSVCLYVFDSMNINCNSIKCVNIVIPTPTNCTAAFTQVRDTSSHSTIKYNFTSASGYNGTLANYLWTFGDGDTSHAKNPVHIYAAAGTYTACLNVMRAADSCNVTHCQNVSIATGVTEVGNELQLAKFYPNPFDEHITIELNSSKSEKLNIIIYDLAGRTHYTNEVLLSRSTNQIEIETNTFPKGVYLIKLSAGGESYYRKLIK